MLTFKEYILLEGRVNWNEYGSWINSKTREVLDVVTEQGHGDIMDEWLKEKKLDPRGNKASFSSINWAMHNGWVRLIHKDHEDSMNIQGSIKNIKKIWRMIAKNAMKLTLYIDLDGKSQPFASDSFNMTLPKERNEWLKHM